MFYVVKNTDNGLYFRGFDENMKTAWAGKMPCSCITESQKTEVMQSLGNYFHIEMIPVVINEKPLAEPKNYRQIIITIINSAEEIYQFTTRDFDVKFVYREGKYSHICLKKPTATRKFTASNGWEIFMEESLFQGSISSTDKDIYIGIKNTNDKISHNEFKEAMQAMMEFVNQSNIKELK